MLYKDEAIVLRTMRLGEADRIVTLIGRANGKIRAVAKGVRKTKSRFGGRLEPFSQVSLVLWRGKSGLDTINQVEVVDPYRGIREDLDKFALGEVMLEVVDRVVQEREQAPRTASVLIEGLQGLRAGGSSLVLACFLMRISAIAGFGASLDRCAECGAAPAWFSPEQGGAVCPRCRSTDSEEVGTGVLELLSDIVREGPWVQTDPEVAATAMRLSRFYAEYHLERRLRSAAAVQTLLQGRSA
ncbi:MAG: DNA repair protein RecO [Actinomycetota bacterium]|nr:DNA repair protein RecO [Actinomycetota bacterium]